MKRTVTSTPGVTPTPNAIMPSLQRFLILARKPNEASGRLAEILSPLGKAQVIADSAGGRVIWYPDEVVKGMAG